MTASSRHLQKKGTPQVHGLLIEHRSLDGAGMAQDIARHMYGRQLRGKVAVACVNPIGMMAATKKAWLKLMRQVQKERASTLNAVLIEELTHQAARMQNMHFSAKAPLDDYGVDVQFATPEQFLLAAPQCHTFYIACSLDKVTLHMITSWQPRGGLVVIYGSETA